MNNRLKLRFFKLFFIGIVLALSACDACRTGLNVSALSLSPDHVIDYAAMVRGGDVGSAILAYAGISSPLSESKYAFNDEIKTIDLSIAEMRNKKNKSGTSIADADAFVQAAGDIEPDVMDVKGRVNTAINNIAAARALITDLGNYLRKPGGGLDTKASTAKNTISSANHGEYDRLIDIIRDQIGKIYGKTVFIAQAHQQKAAFTEIDTIRKALQDLADGSEKFALVMGVNRQDVEAFVRDAQSKGRRASESISLMSSPKKVKTEALADVRSLQVSVAALDPNVVNAIMDPAEKAIMKNLSDMATGSVARLLVVVTDYQPIDDLKFPADPWLEGYIKDAAVTAFVLMLGPVEQKGDTELSTFSKRFQFDENKLVFLNEDDSSIDFVLALSALVVNHGSDDFKKPIDGVYGLNGKMLGESIKTYGIPQESVKEYVTSQAQKMKDSTSDDGQKKNLFVVFADELPEGSDIEGIIKALNNPGRVLIISKRDLSQIFDPDRAAKIEAVSITGFTAAEAFVIAKAKAVELNDARVKNKQQPLNTSVIASVIIKVMRAFVPEKMNIANIISAVEKLFAEFSSYTDPLEQTVEDRLVYLLAQKYPSISVRSVMNSGILREDIKVVDDNVRQNLAYYNDLQGLSRGWLIGSKQEQYQRLVDRRDILDATRVLTVTNNLLNANLALQGHELEGRNQLVLFDQELNRLRLTWQDKMNAQSTAVHNHIFTAIADAASFVPSIFHITAVDAFTCKVPNLKDVADRNDLMFPEAARTAMLNQDFLNPLPDNGSLINRNDFDNSWSNCLQLTTPAPINQIALDAEKNIIDNSVTAFRLALNACIAGRDPSCYATAARTFDTERRKFANDVTVGGAPTESRIARLTQQIPFFVPPRVAGSAAIGVGVDERSYFFESLRDQGIFNMFGPNYSPLVAAPGAAGSFGGDLYTAGVNQGLAAQAKNRNYYVKQLIDLTGTDRGLLKLSFDEYDAGFATALETTTYTIDDLRLGAANPASRLKYIGNVFTAANYDEDTAVMNEISAALADNFAPIAAYALTDILYRDVVLSLRQIVERFFTLPGTSLKEFRNAPPIVPALPLTADENARNDIWTGFTDLQHNVGALANRLNVDFVKIGNGMDAAPLGTLPGVLPPVPPVDPAELKAVGVAFHGLFQRVENIFGLMASGPYGVAPPSGASAATNAPSINPTLVPALDAIRADLEAWLNRVSPQLNDPWNYVAPDLAGGVAEMLPSIFTPFVPGAHPVGESIIDAYMDAYDLHMYYKPDYTKANANPTKQHDQHNGAPPERQYRPWHKKSQGGLPMENSPIKHPLDPDPVDNQRYLRN